MPHALIILVFMAIAIVITSELSRRRRRRSAQFLNRPCAGRDWRTHFPSARTDEIRAFLNLFVESFGFNQRNNLKFRQADRIIDVYRAIHPPGSAIDEFELESFDLALERQYGVSLQSVWREDLTLGEIFAQIISA